MVGAGEVWGLGERGEAALRLPCFFGAFYLPLVREFSRAALAWLPDVADGHTAPNAADLFRPPKLSNAGPGQY